MSASRQAALLYERHRHRLLGLCRGRLASRADAEDALQQTFVYALRCLDRGVVPQNEVAWLNTIAENVCRAWTRNGARRTRRETEAESRHGGISSPNGDGRVAAGRRRRVAGARPE